MLILIRLFSLLFCSSLLACGDATSFRFGDAINVISSPDGKLKSQVIRVGHGETDRSYDIVKIFQGDLEISEYPLIQNQDGMARAVYAIKWSPDSRFLVFLTKYGGGHSIWHSPTSIYDAKNNTFWDLDNYIGSVVGDNFSFSNQDTLRLKLVDSKGTNANQQIEKQFSLADWIKTWSPNSR
jgi:hypothetical protein